MNDASIGDKLRYLRKSRGLVQQEVADRLNMKRSTYSNYEGNRRTPSMNDLKNMAAFFNVGLDYFGIIAPVDEIAEIAARAKIVFSSKEVPQEKKDDLYKELMRLYLNIK